MRTVVAREGESENQAWRTRPSGRDLRSCMTPLTVGLRMNLRDGRRRGSAPTKSEARRSRVSVRPRSEGTRRCGAS